MDSGLIALLLSPLFIFASALVTQWVVRRNAKDANDNAKEATETDRFEAILQGQDTRIKTLESEVEELKTKRATDRAEITRLRQVVRAWFGQLREAWADHDAPMPMPAAEDLDFLGITRG
jgi:hypothetical protein